ncbi:hypothetical protein [Carnobacterium sp. 1290_CSPC]|uniref:hypothetical protein n=1 Tax=Carnobacterium sp. 1290_CSPC TaxID=1579347 RepID=UPI00178CC288|nr:hypothetical protein [Carnobacterium sp. 1290_CSPC]
MHLQNNYLKLILLLYLEKWLPEDLIINITKENILSETAIAVKEAGNYHLR